MKLVDVTADNVGKLGFFCKMSQPKSEGYRRKMGWLGARFDEGLRIKLLDLRQGGRGFIEYLPGEYAWRAVNARGFMFIHCLWVVGASKGKGYATQLLKACIADAKREDCKGVAMLASGGNWLISSDLLAKNGFVQVDAARPTYSLWVLPFGKGRNPSLPDDWSARAKRLGRGLTVVRTDQCPYLDDAAGFAADAAKSAGLAFRVVTFEDAKTLQARAPSPYGVYALVLDGRVLSHHYLLPKQLKALLAR
jgi:GNAT superfamily N-acetyltransferase